jgi:hypothetical protein
MLTAGDLESEKREKPMTTQTTPAQRQAGLNAVLAIAEAIRQVGTAPSGNLYAAVMGRMSLAAYEKAIAILVNANLVAQDQSHLLRWIGPHQGGN